ncbi:MAG TPA: DUF6174 domain-containing protein [Gemmatimonadaceae bacterium]|nr:DUF6174 domain-containing protein [Gemmatimonadaceae bacterium]
MRRWLPCLAIVALACGDGVGPVDQLLTLQRNESRWRAAGVHDYDFDYQLTAMVFAPPVAIQVRNDLVFAVMSKSTGAALPVDGWPTVDSLFVWTRRDLGIPDYNIQITYDGQYHFPAVVSGDIPNAADDEFTRAASHFQPALTLDASLRRP